MAEKFSECAAANNLPKWLEANGLLAVLFKIVTWPLARHPQKTLALGTDWQGELILALTVVAKDAHGLSKRPARAGVG